MDGSADIDHRYLLQTAADPSRWRILVLLSEGPKTVGELVAQLEVAQPSVSHHLGRLREGGLVEVIPEGRTRRYAWAEAPVDSVQAEVQRSLRPWISGALPPVSVRPKRVPAGPIEVHLL